MKSMRDELSQNREGSDDLQRLLAGIPIVTNPCDLDLLVFFQRHPRVLLTSEQIASFVGYDMKQITRSIDCFINAGLLDRKQNPMHAARLYRLLLEGPQTEGLKALLELASNRQGRDAIMRLLDPLRRGPANDPRRAHSDVDPTQRRLHVVA